MRFLRLCILFLLLSVPVCLCGCVRSEESVSFYAMDTFMTMKAYGKNAPQALSAAENEIHELEHLLSVTDSDSEIYRLNTEGHGELSPEASDVLHSALEMSYRTEGAFDATVYPVMRAWGFYGESFTVPDKHELEQALSLVDSGRVSVSGSSVTLGEGQKIDLGGIAKGYASDRVIEILRSYGIDSAIISLGGNVAALGSRPGGGEWNTAVQNPDGSDNHLGIISMTDVSIVTSGAYRRNFTIDGVTYHHIMDPGTGYPAESDLASVTVVCRDGYRADALSTALFVMGCDGAIDYWRSHSDEFDAVLYTCDGTLIITAGLENSFSSRLNVTVVDIQNQL